jgi:hypothetical protein
VALHGDAAVSMPCKLGETAGDELSAQTWRAIADAAGRIVGRPQRAAGLGSPTGQIG